MKFTLRNHVYYAAIDPGGGGGAAPGAQPQGSPTPTPQPGSQGPGQGGGFRETYFQGVPDEVWGQVEPHVRNVQGHLTQLEQRYAPLKGYDEQSLQGLAQFAQQFDRDPVGQWIRMAHGLQAAGVLDEDLDLEHLQALVSGRMPAEPPQPGGAQPQGGEDVPPWAQQLMQKVEALEGGVTQFQTSHRQQVEDAVLNRQISGIKAALKNADFPDDAFTQEQILASYIAHRGNAQAAVQSFINARNSLLKGYVRQANPNPNPRQQRQPNNGNPNDLELPNGAPTPRVQRGRGRGSGMIDKQTIAAASQFLKQQGVE